MATVYCTRFYLRTDVWFAASADDHGLVPCAPALLIDTEGKPAVTYLTFDSVFLRPAQLFISELSH